MRTSAFGWWKCLIGLLSFLLLGGGWRVEAAARKDRPEKTGDGLPTALWNDPNFLRQFAGFDASLEPKISAEEQALYRSLDERQLLSENPRKAIEEIERRITETSSAMLSYTAATLYFREGDVTNALQHYAVAVAKFPKFMRAHKNMGLLLAREGRLAEALPHLTETIKLGGGDSAAYGLLGYCYLNLERHVSAQAAYQNAVLQDPDNADWRLGLIKTFVALGNHLQAAAMLDEMIAASPDRESLWVLQANVFVALEEPMKAAVNLEAVRQMDRATPQNLLLLGDLYLSQELPDLALPAYLEAIEGDDGQHLAKTLRTAEILTSRGAWTQAQTLVDRIRSRYAGQMADEVAAKLRKLEAKASMATGQAQAAIRVLEEIIQQNPLDGEALLLAGDYYAQTDQRERAELRYQAAAGLEDFQVAAWVKHAQLFVRNRQYPEAIGLLKKAQQIKPRDAIQRYLEKVETAAGRISRS